MKMMIDEEYFKVSNIFTSQLRQNFKRVRANVLVWLERKVENKITQPFSINITLILFYKHRMKLALDLRE